MTARASDRGAVTVEAALAMAVLMTFLVLVVGGLMAIVDHLRCVDAAREAARLAARGESERGRTVALDLAPRGADVQIRGDGDTVSVDVRADPAAGLLPGVHLHATAYAVAEPGTVGGPGSLGGVAVP